MSAAASEPKRASRPNEDMATLIAFARFDDHLAKDCPRLQQAAAEDAARFFAKADAAGRLTDRTLSEFWRCAQAAVVLEALDAWNRLAVPVLALGAGKVDKVDTPEPLAEVSAEPDALVPWWRFWERWG